MSAISLHAARAVIDPDALSHNLARVRATAPRSRVLAVIKADAYGHGLLIAARALRDADGFAVARMSEAERLRAAGFRQRILLLPGAADGDELARASQLSLDVVVHHITQLQQLEQAPGGIRVNAWLKIDSGMHRLGFAPQSLPEVHTRLSACAALGEAVRIMTHLADADDLDKPVTRQQLDTMRECTAHLDVEMSLGNSAGILAWPDARSDWVRPGIMLYGISPFADDCGLDHDLRPAMTLRSRLLAINTIDKGGAVGYGGTWVAPETMAIGAAAIGYADGYPRHAGNGTDVLVDGHRLPLAGRVSMDTITVDLRAHQGARVGSPVVVWGDGLPVEDLARAAGTIGYELVCRVSARVPRVVKAMAGPESG